MAGYDFPGNFRAIESIGAIPVLVDVEPNGWMIDFDQIDAALSEETGAVLVSHLHGGLLDMQSIKGFCSRAKIPLVEDACQVPGAIVSGQPAGTFGDAGVFSFGGSKLLTAGRGGAVITDSEDIFQRIKIAAGRGNDAWPLSTLQAAALLPQWDLLDAWNARRLTNAERIRESLHSSQIFGTLTLQWDSQNCPAFYKFPLLLDNQQERDPVIVALQAEGLPADGGFRGFVRRAPRRCRAIGPLDYSRQAAEQLIVLHHPLLLGDDPLIEQVIEALHKVEAWQTDS